MSTSIQSFNAMLKSFLQQLAETFPEEKDIAVFSSMFDDLVRTNVKKPLDLFMDTLSPYADMVMQKNDALFEQPLKLGGSLDLSKIWNTPDLSDSSKAAIWGHIHTLFLLGSTVRSLPPGLLESIDSLAQSCATKIKNGDADFSQVTKELLNGDMLQSVLSGSDGGEDDLDQLNGLADTLLPMLSSGGSPLDMLQTLLPPTNSKKSKK
jgi:hypothetical protein